MLISLYHATDTDIELTAPYNPAQNRVTERFIEILLNTVCSILFNTGLFKYYFKEILKTVYKLNNYLFTSANSD